MGLRSQEEFSLLTYSFRSYLVFLRAAQRMLLLRYSLSLRWLRTSCTLSVFYRYCRCFLCLRTALSFLCSRRDLNSFGMFPPGFEQLRNLFFVSFEVLTSGGVLSEESSTSVL